MNTAPNSFTFNISWSILQRYCGLLMLEVLYCSKDEKLGTISFTCKIDTLQSRKPLLFSYECCNEKTTVTRNYLLSSCFTAAFQVDLEQKKESLFKRQSNTVTFENID